MSAGSEVSFTATGTAKETATWHICPVDNPREQLLVCEPTTQQALAAEGSYVLAGDLIAQSGNAGPCLQPHLHFEVQRATLIDVTNHLNGRILRFIPVDPYGWHPVIPGTSDPYFEIPDLTSTGLSNETLWQVTTNPQ